MPRILHLGVGNFHRAHQAWYTEMANRSSRDRWRITGVSLRSAAMRDRLRAQGFTYTLCIRDGAETVYEPIRAIDDILVAGEAPAAICDAIADPETQIITLTVTEKGYCLNPATGRLDRGAAEIAADLRAPTTIYGFLARGLRQRRANGGGPVTLLSCDNLNANGETLAAALRDFAQSFDPALSEGLARDVTCPNCMVDRITPATTDALRAEVLRETGTEDAAPVVTEAFSDWVIENRFAAARPDWHRVGARFVADVAPFELQKLRLLNGAHSCLAYAGTLRGHVHVHQAVADPALSRIADGLMAEAATTLPRTVREGSAGYRQALMHRFANPALAHRLRQIAMDGSQKLPVRLVASWAECRAAGRDTPCLDAAIGAWMGFVRSETLAGRPLEDPRADEIAVICNRARTPVGLSRDLTALIGAPPGLAVADGVLGAIASGWN